MCEQTWPMLIQLYKGEGRILIIPVIRHMGGFSVDSDWFVKIQEVEDYSLIGKGIFSAIEVIQNSPCSTSTPQERELTAVWRNNSKYKNWVSFWKNNNCACLQFYEDGHYEVYSLQKSKKRNGVYADIIKKITMSAETIKEDIGKAICEVFQAAEEYHNTVQRDYSTKSINLLDGSKLTYKCPKDSHFNDSEDSGAAEIYQCYSYVAQENAESSAEFFLGIAPELDCNLEDTNIRNCWEEMYGKAEEFDVREVEYGIFKRRVEMRNKETHRISYLWQMEEDLLLECGMDVHQPNRRKKLDEKLTKLFEEFALSCKM